MSQSQEISTTTEHLEKVRGIVENLMNAVIEIRFSNELIQAEQYYKEYCEKLYKNSPEKNRLRSEGFEAIMANDIAALNLAKDKCVKLCEAVILCDGNRKLIAGIELQTSEYLLNKRKQNNITHEEFNILYRLSHCFNLNDESISANFSNIDSNRAKNILRNYISFHSNRIGDEQTGIDQDTALTVIQHFLHSNIEPTQQVLQEICDSDPRIINTLTKYVKEYNCESPEIADKACSIFSLDMADLGYDTKNFWIHKLFKFVATQDELDDKKTAILGGIKDHCGSNGKLTKEEQDLIEQKIDSLGIISQDNSDRDFATQLRSYAQNQEYLNHNIHNLSQEDIKNNLSVSFNPESTKATDNELSLFNKLLTPDLIKSLQNSENQNITKLFDEKKSKLINGEFNPETALSFVAAAAGSYILSPNKSIGPLGLDRRKTLSKFSMHLDKFAPEQLKVVQHLLDMSLKAIQSKQPDYKTIQLEQLRDQVSIQLLIEKQPSLKEGDAVKEWLNKLEELAQCATKAQSTKLLESLSKLEKHEQLSQECKASSQNLCARLQSQQCRISLNSETSENLIVTTVQHPCKIGYDITNERL